MRVYNTHGEGAELRIHCENASVCSTLLPCRIIYTFNVMRLLQTPAAYFTRSSKQEKKIEKTTSTLFNRTKFAYKSLISCCGVFVRLTLIISELISHTINNKMKLLIEVSADAFG